MRLFYRNRRAIGDKYSLAKRFFIRFDIEWLAVLLLGLYALKHW